MPARTAFSFGPRQLRNARLREKRFDVSILTKDWPYHNSAVEGYLNEFKSKSLVAPSIVRIPGGLSWDEACLAVREIIKSKPDAIVPMGSLCSQATRYILKKEKADVLILHAGVERPEFLDLLPTLEDQFRATGITSGSPIYTASMHILYLLRPRMKHILIPYSTSASGGSLANAAALAKHYFKDRGIEVTVVPFFKDELPMQRITPFLDGVDTVMCFEGCETQRYAKALANECKRRGILIYGGDIDLVKNGAAVGFVLDYSLIGRAIARYAYKSLWLGTPLNDLPLLALGANARRIVMNEEVVKELGVAFDEDVMHLIQRGTVYGNIFLGDAGMLLGEEMPEKEE